MGDGACFCSEVSQITPETLNNAACGLLNISKDNKTDSRKRHAMYRFSTQSFPKIIKRYTSILLALYRFSTQSFPNTIKPFLVYSPIRFSFSTQSFPKIIKHPQYDNTQKSRFSTQSFPKIIKPSSLFALLKHVLVLSLFQR